MRLSHRIIVLLWLFLAESSIITIGVCDMILNPSIIRDLLVTPVCVLFLAGGIFFYLKVLSPASAPRRRQIAARPRGGRSSLTLS